MNDVRRVVELRGCTSDWAIEQLKRWQFNLTKARYCVYWPKANRTFLLPITYLAAFGDTERACREWIKDGFSGEAKEQSVPWLTPYGRKMLAKELGAT